MNPRQILLLTLAAFPAALRAEPPPPNTEKNEGSPMPAAEAAATMQLPEGFKVTVFASEPDVQNPIACSWDSRGRLWIAENYTYERRRDVELPDDLHDRVLIFEDTDQDGEHDERTVFADGLDTLTSIEWSPGGLYLMCPPNLLFIPDLDRDDRPDGPAEVVLDGFTRPPANDHNFANGLRWGPDGWLYGRCGASAPGEVGQPGTPAEQRIPLRGTVWRYHPRTRVFEGLSCGCTNPWGHDWDQHGQLFFINTVNGHFWHHITGSHMVRSHTIDPNPYSYQLMDHHADHWHFDTGGSWTKSRDGAANEFGGGHAHIGMMIYQGDNWPEEYHNSLFTLNMHGRRANREILERHGSGYVARHAPDLFVARDPFFRGIELTTGPGGAVYILDWSDTGECHENTGVHRTSGRIYRISAKPVRTPRLSHELAPRDLASRTFHPNAWHHRMAAAELRAMGPELREEIASSLGAQRLHLEKGSDSIPRLRSLWLLYQCGLLEDEALVRLLNDPDEHLRAWAIRLLTDHFPLDTVTGRQIAYDAEATHLGDHFRRLARNDRSSLVRLTLASILQRLPLHMRAGIAEGLVSHPEDAGDHNLPLMTWYGLAPVAEKFPDALVQLASSCEFPLVRRFIVRRLAEDIEANPEAVDSLLTIAAGKPEAFHQDILAGLTEAFRGWQRAPEPSAWKRFAETLPADDVRDLAVLFGDGRALDDVKRIALDGKVPLDTRKAALRSLIQARHPELKEICIKLVETRFLNSTAANGLTLFDDPVAAKKLAASFKRFHHSEYDLAIDALASRPVFATALLDEIASGRIPRSRLTPFHARQIRAFQNDELTAKLERVWGEARDTPAEKKELIDLLKHQLRPARLRDADLAAGRAVYQQVCASCHLLYGEGQAIGPDLTGSGRGDLDYLLENIIAPEAEVSADYRVTIFTLADGRTLTGFTRSETGKTLTLQTMTEEVTIAKGEVMKRETLPMSLMPAGLLETLEPDQQRNLIAYLMHPNQVRLEEN